MPSSISTFLCVALPSSSTLSEPRRSGSVPSSSTVTPGAATRWPMRPVNALAPLRLKSPSRPWPIASCSSTPGQPGPSTTLIRPALAGRDRAVGARDEDDVVLAREPRHHLDDARVLAAREPLDLLEQRDLLRAVER